MYPIIIFKSVSSGELITFSSNGSEIIYGYIHLVHELFKQKYM